jgi:hypothetical protein
MTTPLDPIESDDFMEYLLPLFGGHGVRRAVDNNMEAFRPVWDSTCPLHADGHPLGMDFDRAWPQILAIIHSPGAFCFVFEEAHVLQGLRRVLPDFGLSLDSDNRVALDQMAPHPNLAMLATFELLFDHNILADLSYKAHKKHPPRFHLVVALAIAVQYNLPLLAAMCRCVFFPNALNTSDVRESARRLDTASIVSEMHTARTEKHGLPTPWSRLFNGFVLQNLRRITAVSHSHGLTMLARRRKNYTRYRDVRVDRFYRFLTTVCDGLRTRDEEVERLGECPVCLDQLAMVQCVPCGHNLCPDCAPQLENCPLCRSQVDERQEVDLPPLQYAMSEYPGPQGSHNKKKKKKKKKKKS